MAILKGVGDFFGLDIGATGVRVVQLAASGSGRWALRHYGYAPLDIKTSLADSDEARQRLGEVIMTVIGQSGIKTKNVAINIPSNKSFVTVIDLPQATEAELKSTIKYQLDQYIPMAVEDAKIDWALLGQSLHDPSQQEVLLASTAVSYAEDRLELIEGLGLDVIAAEPDALAMIRAVVPPGQANAQVLVHIGEQSTDVAVVYGDTPRLVRTVPVGLDSLVRAAVQNLNIQEDQARQFILKFGLVPDKLEGKVVQAIDTTLDGFASELSKSVKFFQTRYTSLAVDRIVLAGFAGTIPGLDQYIANKLSIQAVPANPWQHVAIPQNDQNLMAVTSEFATVIGLAERNASL